MRYRRYKRKLSQKQKNKRDDAFRRYLAWVQQKNRLSFTQQFGVLESNANEIRWFCLHMIQSRDFMNTLLTQAGAEAGFTISDNTTFRVAKAKIKYNFRNLALHPMNMEIYECMSRNDNNQGTVSERAFVMNALVNGWDEQMQAAQVNVIGTGTVVEFTQGNVWCCSKAMCLNPYKSNTFCQQFKIVKRVRGNVESGQEFNYTLTAPDTNYDDHHLKEEYGEGITHFIGGATKFLLIGIRGVLANSVADEDVIGWMTSHLGYSVREEGVVIKVDEYADNVAFDFVSAHPTATDYQGPTDEADVVDDP